MSNPGDPNLPRLKDSPPLPGSAWVSLAIVGVGAGILTLWQMEWFDELWAQVGRPHMGVVVGFVLATIGAIALDLWREGVQAKRVRTMLRLEVQRNVDALSALNARLSRPGKTPTVPEPPNLRNLREWSEVVHRAAGLVDQPFPVLPQVVWTGQVNFMPRALSEEQIEHLAGFYAAIDRLTVLHGALVVAMAATPPIDPTTVRDGPRGEPPPGPGSVFDQRVSQNRSAIVHLLDETIAAGERCLLLLRRR
jgi:hypothetical protein